MIKTSQTLLFRHAIIGASIAVAVTIASLYTSRLSLDHDRAEARYRAENRGQVIASAIERELQRLELITRGVGTAVSRDTQMDQDTFGRIAEQIIAEGPDGSGGVDILNIAAAPDLVLRYVYPMATNESVIGIDYRDLPDQLPAVRAAMNGRQPVITGPVALKQGGTGLIIRVGVTDLETGQPWGVVAVVALVDDLFATINSVASQSRIDFAIVDMGHDGAATEPTAIVGDLDALADNPVVLPVQLRDKRWSLMVMPQSGWPQAAANTLTIWMIFAGLGGSVFVIMIVMERLFAARRQAEDMLENAIGAIDDGFAVFDANDRLVTSNRTYKTYYPRSAEAIVPGTSFADIIRCGIERGEYVDAIGREEEWFEQRMARHRALDSDDIQQLADGRWIRVSEKRLADGSTVGFRVDITELVRSRQAAEDASHAKSLFLDQMSHELRTPLAILMGYAAFLVNPRKLGSYKALAETADPDALERFERDISGNASRLHASGQRLSSLIDRILDVSDMDGGKRATDLEDLSVDALLSVAAQGPHLPAGGARVVQPDATGLFAHGNAEEMQRAIVSILRHAAEGFSDASLRVTANRAERDITLAFEISGLRKPLSLPARIFGEALGSSAADQPDGDVGLDLAIAEQLVLRSGGSFHYRRSEQTIDRIEIRLPAGTPPTSRSNAA
ncbi:PAS-domain containing protein [Roseivivax sp. CAU 1753]